MRLTSAAFVLSLSVLADALPGQQWAKRQMNSSSIANTTAPTGGASVAPIATGALTTVTSTTTLVTGVTAVVSIVLSIGINGALVPVATYGPVPGAIAAPGAGAVPAGPAAAPGQAAGQAVAAGQGSSGAGAAAPAAVGLAGAAACTCAPAVVATGVYTVTVVNKVNLGTSTYTTVYPTTTLGLITVQGGTIRPATPTVTYSAVVAANTNAALPAGQSYQTIFIPGSNGAAGFSITVVVSVVANINVNVGAGTGNGGGAGVSPANGGAPFGNGTASAAAASSSASSASVSSTAFANPTAVVQTPIQASQTAPTTAAVASPTTATSPNEANVQVANYGVTPLYNQPNFISAMIAAHNLYRARHGSGDVQWSADLAAFALQNVRTNIAAGSFEHSGQLGLGQPYGENLGYQSGSYNNPLYLVYLWYVEINQYNYSQPGFSLATGHFTQLVWVNSKTIGCAYDQATDGASSKYLACEYTPAGNFDGQFQSQVPPPNGNAFPAQPAQVI